MKKIIKYLVFYPTVLPFCVVFLIIGLISLLIDNKYKNKISDFIVIKIGDFFTYLSKIEYKLKTNVFIDDDTI